MIDLDRQLARISCLADDAVGLAHKHADQMPRTDDRAICEGLRALTEAVLLLSAVAGTYPQAENV